MEEKYKIREISRKRENDFRKKFETRRIGRKAHKEENLKVVQRRKSNFKSFT